MQMRLLLAEMLHPPLLRHYRTSVKLDNLNVVVTTVAGRLRRRLLLLTCCGHRSTRLCRGLLSGSLVLRAIARRALTRSLAELDDFDIIVIADRWLRSRLLPNLSSCKQRLDRGLLPGFLALRAFTRRVRSFALSCLSLASRHQSKVVFDLLTSQRLGLHSGIGNGCRAHCRLLLDFLLLDDLLLLDLLLLVGLESSACTLTL